MEQARILVILPALNEAGNIGKTVQGIRQVMPDADVLVVNDGSVDETGREARSAGAIVLQMPYNVGIGAAVQTAFKFAAQQGYDIVVRNDGDGQHSAADITRLIDTLQTSGVDVVIGSRFLGDGDYGTPLLRRLGITVLRTLLRRITAQPITDPTSGFAAFNRRAIRFFALSYPHDYPEPEAIVLLHRGGMSMCEIPVTFLEREHGTSSFTAPTRSAYYMLKVTLAILINLLRRRPVVEG